MTLILEMVYVNEDSVTSIIMVTETIIGKLYLIRIITTVIRMSASSCDATFSSFIRIVEFRPVIAFTNIDRQIDK